MPIHPTSWKRYGKHRTYYTEVVHNPNQGNQEPIKLGWVDEVTGEVMEQSPGGEQVIREYRANHAPVSPVEAVEPSHDTTLEPASTAPQKPLESPIEPPTEVTVEGTVGDGKGGVETFNETVWEDLALHRPGEMARKKAEEEWTARKQKRGLFWATAGRLMDAKTEERAWRIGAEGERAIGLELEKLLPYGFHILHSLPIGDKGSDVDHLVVGPGGCVSVNSKYHPDGRIWVVKNQVRVNGNAQPYLRNSRFEANRVSKILSKHVGFHVPTISALIFRLGDGGITIKEDPEDVLILRAGRAWETIRDYATGLLSPQQIEDVYGVARKSTTWVK